MDNKCKLKEPEEDIGYLIWRITKYWQRGKHKSLDEFGLTASQLEILGAIHHLSCIDEVEVTQIILSQKADIDPMTTSTILRNLQRKGLISRKESKTDTRARIVELTDLGRGVSLKALSKIEQIQNKIFANIDKEALKEQLQILLVELDRFS